MTKGTTIGEQRPAQFAHDQEGGCFCHAASWGSAALYDFGKGGAVFHGGEPPREGDRPCEHSAIRFGVRCQRAAFLLMGFPTLVLDAGGFFSVSAAMLARSTALVSLLKAKQAGRTIEAPKEEAAPKRVINLMDASSKGGTNGRRNSVL